ncbi:MAG: N-6 DNA methylase [Candidatus Competibacteraceae bacterium]
MFDPACGSGGMFVQSSHFIERGQDTSHRIRLRAGKDRHHVRLAGMVWPCTGLSGIHGSTPSIRTTSLLFVLFCDFADVVRDQRGYGGR